MALGMVLVETRRLQALGGSTEFNLCRPTDAPDEPAEHGLEVEKAAGAAAVAHDVPALDAGLALLTLLYSAVKTPPIVTHRVSINNQTGTRELTTLWTGQNTCTGCHRPIISGAS
jgi:hypothetical protein